MKINSNKLTESIERLNTILHFVESNIQDEKLQERYIKVVRFQKSLIRDIDKRGRKIPELLPSVCEITGLEVNSIREKEPPFHLEPYLHLSYGHDNPKLLSILSDGIPHNTYSQLLNNYSLKAIKKILGRKVVLQDLSNIEDNLTLIMESFKHRDYFKKYIDIETFERSLDKIEDAVHNM